MTTVQNDPKQDPKREALIAKIKKLKALSECAGATEAEALAAASRMAQLIAEHNVGMDELTLRRDAKGCVSDFHYSANAHTSEWFSVSNALGELFHTRSYYTTKEIDLFDLGTLDKVRCICFFGYPEDVAAARAMAQLIELAIIGELSKKKNAKFDRGSFEIGMAQRLSEKLRNLIKPVVASSSTGLMVLKDQLVNEEYAAYLAAQQINLTPGRSFHVADPRAVHAGMRAAERIDLHQIRKVR